jgi:hypothetical protein
MREYTKIQTKMFNPISKKWILVDSYVQNVTEEKVIKDLLDNNFPPERECINCIKKGSYCKMKNMNLMFKGIPFSTFCIIGSDYMYFPCRKAIDLIEYKMMIGLNFRERKKYEESN